MTEKATLPLPEGPSKPVALRFRSRQFTHTGYDATGNRTLMANATGRYTSYYDGIGQTMVAALPNSKMVTYAWDEVATGLRSGLSRFGMRQ
ncbi:MAG: hypothetical protein R3C19_27025 [Planctomycetaceae bacterium]